MAVSWCRRSLTSQPLQNAATVNVIANNVDNPNCHRFAFSRYVLVIDVSAEISSVGKMFGNQCLGVTRCQFEIMFSGERKEPINHERDRTFLV